MSTVILSVNSLPNMYIVITVTEFPSKFIAEFATIAQIVQPFFAKDDGF